MGKIFRQIWTLSLSRLFAFLSLNICREFFTFFFVFFSNELAVHAVLSQHSLYFYRTTVQIPLGQKTKCIRYRYADALQVLITLFPSTVNMGNLDQSDLVPSAFIWLTSSDLFNFYIYFFNANLKLRCYSHHRSENIPCIHIDSPAMFINAEFYLQNEFEIYAVHFKMQLLQLLEVSAQIYQTRCAIRVFM